MSIPGIDRRPPDRIMSLPPEPTRSTVPAFDLGAVTRLLVGGQWDKVKPGIFRPGTGAKLALLGTVVPTFVFETTDGVPAIVRVDAVQGWAPVPDPRGEV